MTKPMILETNCKTGEKTYREITPEEHESRFNSERLAKQALEQEAEVAYEKQQVVLRQRIAKLNSPNVKQKDIVDAVLALAELTKVS